MKLPKFEVEQWMTNYEGKAVYNLTDTCVSPLKLQELLAMDTDHLFQDLTLDYGAITGDPMLKKALLSLYQTGSEANITTAQGCLQASEMVMNTVLEAGDTVISYVPGYQAFIDYPRSIGCKVIPLRLYEEDGWQPKLAELEEAMKEPVKMIIVNNPSNPTGTVFEDAYLSRLIALSEKNHTMILSDEIYRDPACRSLSDRTENAVSVSSLSKMYSLAGLRFGWLKGPADLIEKINERRDYSIISTGPVADILARIALENKDAILQRSRTIISACKDAVREFLERDPRFSVVLPDYGTVSFLRYEGNVPSETLALHALNRYGVFFVPGSCFACENHLRLGLTCREETMRKGLVHLAQALDDLTQ